jgi:hypothetical protein
MTNIRVWGVAMIGAMAAGGCGGGPSKIEGKVIKGQISFAVTVEGSDGRMKEDGLAGVEVEAYAPAERGGGLLGAARTDGKGNFALNIRDSGAMLRPVEFTASAPGYIPASGVMSVPPTDKRVLILLKPGAAGGTR